MKFANFLEEYLAKGGLRKNDKVLLHSNVSLLCRNLTKMGYKFSIKDILEVIVNYIGINGTLIFPTFNFDFCKNSTYSAKFTSSQMGILSEVARIEAKENRTWHPVYSFAILGEVPKNEIIKKNYSALGKESIFQWLHDVDGKIAVINLSDQKSMTFYHHVEELLKVNWRYFKIFKGEYIDFKNNKTEVNAEIFVRDIENGVLTKVDEMEKILWEKKLYISSNNFSHNNCRSIKVRKMKKEVEKIINSNDAYNKLYEVKNYQSK